MNFQKVNEILKELNETNSSLDKLNVLKKYKDSYDLKTVLYYTFNPFLKYNISSSNLKKQAHLKSFNYGELVPLLIDLNARKITGHEAISEVNGFIYTAQETFPECAEIIFNIIDRNLKIRLDEKSINKVFPDLIPTFEIALAAKYDENTKKKINFRNNIYGVQRKLDGVRCITIVKGDDIQFYSRAGNKFETLENLIPHIKQMHINSIEWVIDGELCMVDDNGLESFTGIMKQINRKEHQIKNPRYIVFDLIPLEEFQAQTGRLSYLNRIERLYQKIKDSGVDQNFIKPVETIIVNSFSDVDREMEKAVEKGWEGLIFKNMNATYQGKRNENILKIKEFSDAEYKVLKTVNGPFRTIVNGKEIEEEVLSNIVISHKGNEVSVGSGFSLDQRREFYKYPERIIGKIITVKYFAESVDKNGKLSLRFPTLKAIYEGQRNI